MAPEKLKELPTAKNFLYNNARVVLGSIPHLLYTPKENIVVFAGLGWVGKVYRAQGCYQKHWRLEDTGVRAGSVPVPWETPVLPCPMLLLAWNTKAIMGWITAAWTHKRNSFNRQ